MFAEMNYIGNESKSIQNQMIIFIIIKVMWWPDSENITHIL